MDAGEVNISRPSWIISRLTLLVVVFLLPLSSWAQGPDIRILRSINSPDAVPTDNFFRFLNCSDYYFVAGVPVIIGLAGIVTEDDELTASSLTIAGACVINLGITSAFKYSINRERPFEAFPDIEKKTGAGSPSFPSGHTAFAFCSATSLSLQYPEWYVIVPSYLWAGSVAYSGMHLGVHYPSDILAGAITGAFSAWLSYRITGILRQGCGKK